PNLPRALIEKLDPSNPAEAEALVMEHLEQAGIELIGTRSAAEIAERLLGEAADMRETPLPRETAAVIENYVAVKCPAREAAARIGAIMRGLNVDIAGGLDAFQRRLDLIAKAGVDLATAEFSAEFGRN